MGTSEQLRSAWSVLDGESWVNPGVYERRLPGTGVHSIYALLLRPEGQVGLALDVPPEAGTTIADDSARGFVLEKKWNADAGRTRISLTLTDRKYRELFAALACDVAEKVARASTVEKGCIALVNRLAHWKRFLKATGDDGLSVERQTGLYGELLVLKALFERMPRDPGAAISAWLGPTGANQDFSRLGKAVEVKSTVANDFSGVQVASERQLDESAFSVLLLCQMVSTASKEMKTRFPT